MKKFIFCIVTTVLFYSSVSLFAQENENVVYSSKSNGYEYSVKYPAIVKKGKNSKMTVSISNKTNRHDKELTIEIRDITGGDGVGPFLQNWDKAPCEIIKIDPKSKYTEVLMGSTYIDYDGLKVSETKEITIYFKILKAGNYLQKLMFYTDKHADEEYELISVLTIRCKK